MGLLDGADAVTVLTGAGVSTASGIPDYRGPQGTWTRDPSAERMATLEHYLGDPGVRRRSWQSRLTSPLWGAAPNAAHRALAALSSVVPTTVVTQNVDGLHQAAGSSPVLELHGNAHRTRCWTCHDERPMADALDRVRAGEEDPPCLVCGGILKSATVLFGENLDPAVIEQAFNAAASCSLFLVAGSSLAVYPAAGLVPHAVKNGARLIIANAQETPYDGMASAVLRGDVGVELGRLVRGRT